MSSTQGPPNEKKWRGVPDVASKPAAPILDVFVHLETCNEANEGQGDFDPKELVLRPFAVPLEFPQCFHWCFPYHFPEQVPLISQDEIFEDCQSAHHHGGMAERLRRKTRNLLSSEA